MGTAISLYVDFSKVEQKQWEAVYDETLQLLEKYSFMDKIVDDYSYNETMIYADRTRERYLTPWYPRTLGWYTIGDLKSFEHAEAFALAKDIGFYKKNENVQETGDIYFCLTDNYSTDMSEREDTATCCMHVFNGKTQGYAYHTYLLGVATLIEDRLKPHAAVSGDITRAQLQESVHWVNQHLEKPIALPDRCSFIRLFPRIKQWAKEDSEQIELLFSLLLYPENKVLGEFIRENFSLETIHDYWTRNLEKFTPSTIGMGKAVERYLNMYFPIEGLCNILVFEDNEIDMSPMHCILTVLKSGILSKQQVRLMSMNNQTDAEPVTIPSLLGKTVLSMAGSRDSTTQYVEEQKLKQIFYTIFKKKGFVDEAFKKYTQKAEHTSLIDIFEKFLKDQDSLPSEGGDDQHQKRYDIEEPGEIIFWQEGDRKSVV